MKEGSSGERSNRGQTSAQSSDGNKSDTEMTTEQHHKKKKNCSTWTWTWTTTENLQRTVPAVYKKTAILSIIEMLVYFIFYILRFISSTPKTEGQ